jgi:hypothetical protein
LVCDVFIDCVKVGTDKWNKRKECSGKKGVIMDSENQMCSWVHMAKMLQWECDGEILVTMLINLFKYIEMHSITFQNIEIHWNTLKIL